MPQRAYTYRFEWADSTRHAAGSAVLVTGSVRVHAQLTEEDVTYAYAALHLGGHDAHCAIGGREILGRLPIVSRQLTQVFEREPLSAAVRAIDAVFGADGYGLRDLFHGERRAILHRVVAQALAPCLTDLESIYDRHTRMLHFLTEADVPVPDGFRQVARVVLQERVIAALRRLADGTAPLETVTALWQDAARWHVKLAEGPLQDVIEHYLRRVMDAVAINPATGAARALALLDAAVSVGVQPDVWSAQNAFYDFVTGPTAAGVSPESSAMLRRLGERLGFGFAGSGHTISPRAMAAVA